MEVESMESCEWGLSFGKVGCEGLQSGEGGWGAQDRGEEDLWL